MLSLESVSFSKEEPKLMESKTPVEEYCNVCKKTVTTSVHKTFGMVNFMLFIACLFFPCLVVCFWCKCWKDYDHLCPECKKVIGRHDLI